MLQSITIHGLRGFGEPTTIPLSIPNGTPGSGLTIFTGANNAGKTTAIEALRYHNMDQNSISFSEGKRNTKTTPPNHIKITFHRDDDTNFIVETVPEGGSQATITGDIRPSKTYILQSRRYVDYEMHNPYPNQDRNSFIVNLLQNTRNRTFYLNSYEQRIFKWRDHKADFDKILKQIIQEPFDWAIEQNDNGAYYIKIIFADHSITHTREGIGDGYWSIFTIADALYDSNPGDIIAIDEPELSLHPTLQKRVLKLLEEYSETRQIIITTHSQYFISAPSIVNGGNLIRFYKNSSGNITIGAIDNDDRHFINAASSDIFNPHVLGLKARELFFIEDNVIITEGQEDVIIMSRICQDLNLTLKANFFGWGAGGAEKIAKVLHLLRNLGFTKVTAIYDGDKQNAYENCLTNFPEYNILILPKDDIRDKPATPAKDFKEGMSDEHGNLKEENIESFNQLINSINVYHNPS